VPPGAGVGVRPNAARPANPSRLCEVLLLVVVVRGFALGAGAGTGVAAGAAWVGAAPAEGLLLLVPVGRAWPGMMMFPAGSSKHE
jgi:hypothetical protein